MIFAPVVKGASKGMVPQFNGRLSLPHTWNRTECFDSALCKSGYTTESLQVTHPDLHRRRPLTTDSKEDRQELGVGNYLWGLSQ